MKRHTIKSTSKKQQKNNHQVKTIKSQLVKKKKKRKSTKVKHKTLIKARASKKQG